MLHFIISRILIAVMCIAIITTSVAILGGYVPSDMMWYGYLGTQIVVLWVLLGTLVC